MNIHLDNGNLGLVCFGGFALIFIILLIIAALTASKRRQATRAASARLGFVPEAQPDAGSMDALAKVYAPAKVTRVGNLSVKATGDERLYLFDLTTVSQRYGSRSSVSTNTEYSNVGVSSQRLELPAFMLFHRNSMPGRFGSVVDGVLESGAAMAGFHEVTEVPTAFQLNYILLVKDDLSFRSVFTNETLDHIAMLENVVARGEGSLLVFNRFEIRNSGKPDEVALAQLVDQARQISGWLER